MNFLIGLIYVSQRMIRKLMKVSDSHSLSHTYDQIHRHSLCTVMFMLMKSLVCAEEGSSLLE